MHTAPQISALIRQSLAREAWTLKRAGSSFRCPASVPGDVYADLLAAGAIPDPFHRDNEKRVQWIGETDWIYACGFQVSQDLLARQRVLLRCQGLDTLATVTVNGRPVGCADNMHRVWEFDVRDVLRAGRNRLEIRFGSAEAYIREKGKGLHIDGHHAPNMAHIRKQHCNFGWDWGIKAVTCGIWRPIELLAFNTARLSDVRVAQDHRRKGAVVLTVDSGVERTGKSKLSARVTVSLRGETVAAGETGFTGKRGSLELRVENPQLWWPNTLGGQPLYTVAVELRDTQGGVLDVWTRRIGLRTLRIGLHTDEWGESFQFEVNGVPFFAKGANWVPADALLSRLNASVYRARVQAAADVHMNMLRVWGGGIYEDEAFYDACDELGICVWQDFMFGGTAYPTTDNAFMANVRAEAVDVVKRLRHHACLALWCGNNEIESNKYFHKHPVLKGWKTYKPLFDRLLPGVLASLDPGRDYWPSSPHKSTTNRNQTSNPTNGNVHFWRVWHGKEPFEFYRTRSPRFVTEYGVQSFPEPKTVYGFTEEEDRNITTRVMEHHQRSGRGNALIMEYMLNWFRMPSGFANVLWASQILQGIALKIGTEHWRRCRPCTMGTLYWQLNDNWPVASWSSIDYHGRWKAAHYMARHFFAPLMVSGLEDAEAGTVDVHVTNDLRTAVPADLEWTVTDTDGKPLLTGRKTFRASALSSRKVSTLRLRKPLRKVGPDRLLVWLKLTAPGQPASTNLVFFSRPKHLELSPDPAIHRTIRKRQPGGYTVKLSSRRAALWTWLEVEGTEATCSDNFFHLRPGQSVTVHLKTEKSLTLPQLEKALRVRSLCDLHREQGFPSA